MTSKFWFDELLKHATIEGAALKIKPSRSTAANVRFSVIRVQFRVGEDLILTDTKGMKLRFEYADYETAVSQAIISNETLTWQYSNSGHHFIRHKEKWLLSDRSYVAVFGKTIVRRLDDICGIQIETVSRST